MRTWTGAIPAILALQAAAQQYIGANACGTCHKREYTAQSATGHARALSHASDHLLAGSFASGILTREQKYRFQFRLEGKDLRVRAADDKDIADIPIEWAFGAGAQAVTFVTRVDPEWYLEHYFSYYSAGRTMAPTPGQKDTPA